jgi:NAD dependent epimerase/dehydratase family enzyme
MPTPARNSEFTHELSLAAHRPAIFPAPAFALKIALGELSHLLLDSQRVLPAATLASGYAYRFPTLEAAARDVFARR